MLLNRSNLTKFVAASGPVLFGTSVSAATTSDNLDITLNIQAACTVLTVDDVNKTVDIGTTGSQTDSGNVTVQCNAAQAYRIAMGAGTNANLTTRNVVSGASSVPYAITTSGGVAWGTNGVTADNSFNTANDLNSMGTGGSQVHGYIVDFTLAGTEASGAYTDTVLVTLEW